MTNRYIKEKEFHNRTFSTHSRKSLGKFYSIAQISNQFYLDRLFFESQDKTLLELGCGPGSRSFQLAENSHRVTGIDISNVAINQAKEKATNEKVENVDFKIMNAESMDFSDNSFDIVCGISILHHLDLKKAYSEISRVLKPEGRAIFIEPLGHNPIINTFRKLTPKLRTEDEHPLMKKDIKPANNYFKEVELHYFHLFTILAVPFQKFSWFAKWLGVLAKIDRALFKLIPLTGRYAWIVIIIFTK